MREWADFSTEEAEGGAVRIVFSGPLVVSSIGVVDRRLRACEDRVAEVDLSQISDIDTVGAWMALRVAREHKARIVGTDDRAKRLIAALADSDRPHPEAPDEGGLVKRSLAYTGEFVEATGKGTVSIIGFLGSVLVTAGQTIRHPSRLRGKAVIRQFELVGVTALPIIGLMCFLVGIVITQLGSEQLRDYGLDGFTVNLTGRISMRELGPLMAAIMVAGRSGSSFAAQLGTMKLTEEVDAMRTIGVSPIEALILPRVMAGVLLMPLLGFFAASMSIIGGAFIASLTLNSTFLGFLGDIKDVVPTKDLWVCLIKAPFFGLVIALTGCFQGLQVKADSEEVGLRTTMAVVQAIFMVIVMDAFFAVFFSKVGWG
ncbi:ABC transporter permease [Novosphingobium sp. TH158]|nr:ABC transporter permease [Novosphingobium sp. TH158]PLK26494.1 ABC transporter permease [Novosphingobium sp. TH158]